LELTELKYRILDKLLFAEPFDTLCEELAVPVKIIGADLKWLIAHKCVQVLRPSGDQYITSAMLDVDDMRAFHYQATALGLQHYRAHQHLFEQ